METNASAGPGRDGEAELGRATARRVRTLLVVVFLERLAYYGFRSIHMLMLCDSEADGGLGLSDAAASAVYGSLQTLTVWALLIGGVVALAAGPRITLALGSLLFAAALLLTAPGASVGISEILLGLGHGLIVPSVYVIAAQWIPIGKRGFLLSLFFAVYACANLGAFTGPLTIGFLGERVSWAAARLTVGLVMTVALVLAIGIVLVDRGRPRPVWCGRRRLFGLLVLLPFMTWFCFARYAGFEWVSNALFNGADEGYGLPLWYHVVYSLTEFLTPAAAILTFAASRRGWTPSPTAHYAALGLGLAALTLFAQVAVLSLAPRSFWWLLFVSAVTNGLSWLLLFPVLVTASSGFGERFGALVVAGFLVLAWWGPLVGAAARSFSALDAGPVPILGVAALTLVLAAVLGALRDRVSSLLSVSGKAA